MSWNPAQYLKFEGPRLRPAVDLLARIDLPAPRRIVDLGCGTGQIARMLAARWPAAQVTGVDNSAEMLAEAARGGGEIVWLQQDLAAWRADPLVDLLVSTAALHWVLDHGNLFPTLMRQVAPGGVLAIQMPRNFDAASHTTITATVRDGPWRERLEPLIRPTPVGAPERYFELLAPHAADVDVWQTEYLHVLDGPDPVKEWTKGSWLAPFLEALSDPAERQAFETAYADRVRSAYPPRQDGRTLFPFRRLFVIARAR